MKKIRSRSLSLTEALNNVPGWFKWVLLLVVLALAYLAANKAEGTEPGLMPDTTVTAPATATSTIFDLTPVAEVSRGRPEKATVATTAGANIQIDIVPFLAPVLTHPENVEIVRRLEADYLSNDLKTGRGYILCNGRIQWTDLLMGAAPDTLKQLIVIRSDTDNISLDQVVVKATSVPGVLSDTYEVPSGWGYGPEAFGVKTDGTKVTSGPGDQKVALVMFVVQMKLFVGGETVAGQNAVKNYVLANGMNITYEVMIRGNDASKRSVTVTTGPWLRIDRVKQDVVEVVAESGDGLLINLFSAPTVRGPWTRVEKGTSVVRWPFHPTDPAQFFRVTR